MTPVTLEEFITPTGEFSSILKSISSVAKLVNQKIRNLNFNNLTGTTNTRNQTGDAVQKLDLAAHKIFTQVLGENNHFSALTSEESKDLVLLPGSSGNTTSNLTP